MERKGQRGGGVNENGSVFGWRDGGDHAGQRIIEENRTREREKRLRERRVLGGAEVIFEGKKECEKFGERQIGVKWVYHQSMNLCKVVNKRVFPFSFIAPSLL